MISYEDLDLRISADGDDFRVTATRGSQVVSEPFDLDMSRPWDFGHLKWLPFRDLAKRGSELFLALICGKVRDLYRQSQGSIGSDSTKGSRLRLTIDPRDPRLRRYVRLPWEIMGDPSSDSGGLQALDPRTPIVRSIDTVTQPLSPASGSLQRVLLASSNPSETSALDLDSERAAIEKALFRLGIKPTIRRNLTRSSLVEAIADGEHQIVHYMGHGDFDPGIGEGFLLLEDERGRPDPLAASTLASLFSGKAAPRLVILGCCRSGEPGGSPAFGPFSSVAGALIASGLPAVIAMQTVVEDRSAIRFTERLYQRLVKNDPVEKAVAEARIALSAENPERLDWAIPVLFARGPAAGVTEDPARNGGETRPVVETPQPEAQAPSSRGVTARDVGFILMGDIKNFNQKGGGNR